jgi:lipopolysaccharide export system permease protein
MKLIERYIFRRIGISFIGTLAVITAIVWIVQGLNRLNIATDSGSTMMSFLYVASLLIPSVIPLIMPFALMLAVVQVFKTMNTDSEMPVIKASGGPKRLIVKPVLILAALAAMTTFVLENGVTPYSRLEFRSFVAEVRANLLTSLLQAGTFQSLDNGLTVHIAERQANGVFGGLFISDKRDDEVEVSYFAREASIVEALGFGQLLFMRDGELHQKDPDNGSISIVRFNSYAFDLSAFAPAGDGAVSYPKDQTTPYLFSPDPANPLFQTYPLEFSGELHRRMTSWTLPVVFALIAVFLAGNVKTARQISFALTGNTMAAGMTYFLIVFVTQDMANKVPGAFLLLYAVPLAASCGLLYLIAHDRTRIPLVGAVGAALRDRAMPPLTRFLGGGIPSIFRRETKSGASK